MGNSAGALDGVRVLDFSAVIAGPFGTRLMADLGAEVVKVEPPVGDLLRGAPPLREGVSPYYGQTNCGKRSISVDLKTPEGIELILQLVAQADVVVQNFRPGVMRDMGLGYDDLVKHKSDIIYASVSGYGQHGPASQWAAYAPIIHASSGYDLAILSYQDDLDKPLNGANATADYLAASLVMGAISAALLKREKTGAGEEIDISMMEIMQNVLPYEIHEQQFKAKRQRPNYGPVRTGDGYIMVNPLSPKNFRDLVNSVGHPEWLEQYPLKTPTDRQKNWSLIMAELEKWALQRTSVECESIIREGGCPCSRYREVWESMQDPQSEHRQGVVEIRDSAGAYKIPTTPLRLMNSEAAPKPFVSDLGEDNAKILRDWLGFDPEKVDDLVETKVLFSRKHKSRSD
jgi:CoA:oxalate CoA-transferase